MNFGQAETMFAKDQIRELAQDPAGLRYLKLRSLNRREYLEKLFETGNTIPSTSAAKGMFKEAFENPIINSSLIDGLISSAYNEERSIRREQEPELAGPARIDRWIGLAR